MSKRKFFEVKRGVTRTVVLVGNYAIKVPTTRPDGRRRQRLWAWCRGSVANESEVAWRGQDGLCPMLWHWGNLVLCFRRATPLNYKVPEPDDFEWWGAIAPDVPFGDRKAINLGIVDGRTVWIDYDSSWNGCQHSRWNDIEETHHDFH